MALKAIRSKLIRLLGSLRRNKDIEPRCRAILGSKSGSHVKFVVKNKVSFIFSLTK